MRLSRVIHVLVMLGLVLVVGLAACSAPAPSTSSSQSQTTAPAAPTGELKVAYNSFGDELFDPIKARADLMVALGPIFDPMIGGTADGKLTPGIIEKWELDAGGLSWTFHVRKGVKFHDGSALTADDIKFTIDRYVSKDATYEYWRIMVDRVEKVDDYTVRIYTKGTQPYLPVQASILFAPCQALVMPKAYIEKNGAEYFNQHPVGTGPFKFVRNTRGDSMEFEAFEDYWGTKAEFKKVTTLLIPEEATQVAMLKTGQLDIIQVGMENAQQLEAAGFRTRNVFEIDVLLFINGAYEATQAGKPISNVKVRQALSMAINRDEINKTLFYGKGRTLPPPIVGGSSPDFDAAYWEKYAADISRYDPEGARKLLQEAGYPNGFEIKVYTFPSRGLTYLSKIAEIVAGYWQKIGVKAEVRPVDAGTANTAKFLKSPDSELMGNAMTYPMTASAPVPAKNLRFQFHNEGTYALVGKTMPELDKLINQATTELDPKKRGEAITGAMKIAADTYTDLTIARVPSLTAIGPNIEFDFPPIYSTTQVHLNLAKHKKK